MAEKKTTSKKETATKKASKQTKPKAVDMVSPVDTADEMGLELTEKMVMEPIVSDDANEEIENPSTEEIMQAKDDAELVFEDNKDVMPIENAVEAEKCDKKDVCDQPCEVVENQELETPEPLFTSDKEMVNDITNILNGIDGVKASKIGEEDKKEEKEEKSATPHKNTTNTEEKNYYSDQFSKSWGGVMYDY